MNEEAAAQDYLKDYLGTDSTLSGLLLGENKVYLRKAPKLAPTPYVKIDRLDSQDLYVVGLTRVWDDMTFLVRGIVGWDSPEQMEWTDARAIADRLDALLHDH